MRWSASPSTSAITIASCTARLRRCGSTTIARDLLERDRLQRVDVELDFVNAGDAFDEGALGVGELSLASADVAQRAQDRLELVGG